MEIFMAQIYNSKQTISVQRKAIYNNREYEHVKLFPNTNALHQFHKKGSYAPLKLLENCLKLARYTKT